jgi:hypothetical protein
MAATAKAEPWIETFSGIRFDFLNPQPEQIQLEDIAHALSNQCRYTGHTRKFYSVAEHCWHTSFIADEKLWGLLHDASEAYISDLSRPVKQLTPIGPPYLEVETRIMQAICSRFGLIGPMPPSVKKADNVMLFTEKKQLMTSLPWTDDPSSNFLSESAKDIKLYCWSPEAAKESFIERYKFLTGDM